MKRILCTFLLFCLLMAFPPIAASAQTYGKLTYTVSEGEATITGCDTSATGALTVPAAIDGYPVTAIATAAFANCTGLTSVAIGAGVTVIETGVFSGCTGLSSLSVAAGNPVYHSTGNCIIETSSKAVIAGCKSSVIPEDGSVTSIGKLAFYNCTALSTIRIPDNVVSIGASAFEGCTQLTELSMGSGVTAIGNSAFLGCTALTHAVIPDSVTAMGVYVFSGCTGLTSVRMGDRVATIGNSAFSGCTKLTDVRLGSSVAAIDVFAFNGCSRLTDLCIPNTVTSIGRFAFYNCSQLKTLQLSQSITAIGSNAFSGCTELSLSIDDTNTYAISYAQRGGIPYTTYGLGSLSVSKVTLKPAVTGIYFSSNLDWAANDSRILSCGIAVSTQNPQPVADGSDAYSLCTQGGTSVLVKGILKPTNSIKRNTDNANTAIYARVYVRLSNGSYLYSETTQITLQQLVVKLDGKWQTLSTAQKAVMKQLYTAYSHVMDSWDIPNLKNA